MFHKYFNKQVKEPEQKLTYNELLEKYKKLHAKHEVLNRLLKVIAVSQKLTILHVSYNDIYVADNIELDINQCENNKHGVDIIITRDYGGNE